MQANRDYPVLRRGKGGTNDPLLFDSVAVIEFREQKAIARALKRAKAPAEPPKPTSALEEKRNVELEHRRLELEIARKEVVYIKDIMPVIQEEMAATRAELLAVHQVIPDKALARIVDDRIRAALNVFKSYSEPFDPARIDAD